MTGLSVVVVAYGSAELLTAALAPLTDPVVVVDNSSDEEVAEVAHRAGARYVDPGRNLGFAAGVNRGIAETPADHDVLVLNPDAVLEPESLHLLRTELESSPRRAVVAPRLVGPDGGAQRVLWPFPSPLRMWREALGLGRLNDRDQEWVTGAVMLIRRAAWEEVGGFDERFFLYQEETDWQRRAVAAGWTVSMSAHATASHVGAGTSSDSERREALFHAGTETYIRKWFGTVGWTSYRTAAVLGALLRALVLNGSRRRAARRRALIYVRGPRRMAGLD